MCASAFTILSSCWLRIWALVVVWNQICLPIDYWLNVHNVTSHHDTCSTRVLEHPGENQMPVGPRSVYFLCSVYMLEYWHAAYKHQTPKLVKLSFETGTLVIKGHDFASTVISSCFYILVLGYVRVVPCAHIFCSWLDMGARAWEVLLILLESLICPLGDFVKHLG